MLRSGGAGGCCRRACLPTTLTLAALATTQRALRAAATRGAVASAFHGLAYLWYALAGALLLLFAAPQTVTRQCLFSFFFLRGGDRPR